MSHFEKDAIISGVGISHIGRRTGIPGLQLTLDAARAAIADAGLTPACGDGEGGPFVDGAARIAVDGTLPLSTYGGQLSAGRMHDYWVLHEACLQLRGQAGERQLRRRPQTAVVAAGGGPIAGCMLLTR